MKKNIILLFAALSLQIAAQDNPNEFSIHGGGGLCAVRYPLADVDWLSGYGAGFGIGYTVRFRGNFGIYIGAESSFYRAEMSADVKTLTSNLTDRNGYAFDLHTAFDYHENHRTAFLLIPVMLQYQSASPQGRNGVRQPVRKPVFYAMGGIKAAIPLQSEYSSKITTLNNSAYYPEFDNWAATQQFAGLGDFDGKRFDGNLELKPSLMLALEAGVKLHTGSNSALYAGVYFDCGLNAISEDSRSPIRNHVAVEQLTNFPLLTSSERMNILSAGVKLRLAFLQTPPKPHSRGKEKGHCPY